MCVRVQETDDDKERLFHGLRNKKRKAASSSTRQSPPSPLTGVKQRARTSSMLYDIATLAISLAALVVGGSLGGLLDAPLVGEIVVGLLLGPDGADFLPHPDAIVLVRRGDHPPSSRFKSTTNTV